MEILNRKCFFSRWSWSKGGLVATTSTISSTTLDQGSVSTILQLRGLKLPTIKTPSNLTYNGGNPSSLNATYHGLLRSHHRLHHIHLLVQDFQWRVQWLTFCYFHHLKYRVGEKRSEDDRESDGKKRIDYEISSKFGVLGFHPGLLGKLC